MEVEYIFWDSFFDELEKNAFFDELEKDARGQTFRHIQALLTGKKPFESTIFKELSKNIPKGVKPLVPPKKIKKSQLLYAAGLK